MEIQLNALFTLLVGVIVYWLGDWLVGHIGMLRHSRFPAPLLGGVLAAAGCAAAGVNIRCHAIAQMALLYVAASGLGFAVRMPKEQPGLKTLALFVGKLVWESRRVKFPPLGSIFTGPGRLGIALCLMVFCMFSGLMVAVSLSQLLHITIPSWLGGPVVAALLRSTTEMTDEEFPERELAGAGTVAFGIFMSIAVTELVLGLISAAQGGI